MEHGKAIVLYFSASLLLCLGECLWPLQSHRASWGSSSLVVQPFLSLHSGGCPQKWTLLLGSENTTSPLYPTSSRAGSHFLKLGIYDLLSPSTFCSSSLQHFSIANAVSLEFLVWFVFLPEMCTDKEANVYYLIVFTKPLACSRELLQFSQTKGCNSEVCLPINFKTPDHTSTPVEYCTCASVIFLHHNKIRATRECVWQGWGKKKFENPPNIIHILWKSSFTCKHLFEGSNERCGFPRCLSGKESTCQCRRCGFSSWIGKLPWMTEWQPTLVFLPEKSRGQRSLAGYSPWGHKRVWNDLATKQQQIKDLGNSECSSPLGLHPIGLQVLCSPSFKPRVSNRDTNGLMDGELTCVKQSPGATPHGVWQTAGKTWWSSSLGSQEYITSYKGTDVRWAH